MLRQHPPARSSGADAFYALTTCAALRQSLRDPRSVEMRRGTLALAAAVAIAFVASAAAQKGRKNRLLKKNVNAAV